MRRFSFRLESILKYRKFLEKKAMLQLAELRQAYIAIEHKIEQLTHMRSQVALTCRGAGLQGLAVPRYENYRSYLEKLRLDLEYAEEELKEQEASIHTQEAVLKSQMLKRKSLEIHKESQRLAHMQKNAREEQKLLDEIVITRQEVNA